MPPADSFDGIRWPMAGFAGTSEKPSEIEREVMRHFDQFRNPMLRYCLSLGIPIHDAEEIIQDVFLHLFRHLQQERPRSNLRGWIFRVAHNLALKHRASEKRKRERIGTSETLEEQHSDPAPSPEERLLMVQRRHRLLDVVYALPEADHDCLMLRAEGLRYREIADVLGMSLGSVANSLARTLARLSRADGR